jgi:hypothetical protein
MGKVPRGTKPACVINGSYSPTHLQASCEGQVQHNKERPFSILSKYDRMNAGLCACGDIVSGLGGPFEEGKNIWKRPTQGVTTVRRPSLRSGDSTRRIEQRNIGGDSYCIFAATAGEWRATLQFCTGMRDFRPLLSVFLSMLRTNGRLLDYTRSRDAPQPERRLSPPPTRRNVWSCKLPKGDPS